MTRTGNQQCPKPDAINPRQVDGVVMQNSFLSLDAHLGNPQWRHLLANWLVPTHLAKKNLPHRGHLQ